MGSDFDGEKSRMGGTEGGATVDDKRAYRWRGFSADTLRSPLEYWSPQALPFEPGESGSDSSLFAKQGMKDVYEKA